MQAILIKYSLLMVVSASLLVLLPYQVTLGTAQSQFDSMPKLLVPLMSLEI